MSAERRKQRLSALGSLAQSTVTFVIFAVVILMILAELGYNITTILAGTTVIARHSVAFGLQSIVKDLALEVSSCCVEDQLGVAATTWTWIWPLAWSGHWVAGHGTARQGRHTLVRRNGGSPPASATSVKGGPGELPAEVEPRTGVDLAEPAIGLLGQSAPRSVIVVPVMALETGQLALAS